MRSMKKDETVFGGVAKREKISVERYRNVVGTAYLQHPAGYALRKEEAR